MATTTATLTDFLLARIAEDEEVARAVIEGGRDARPDGAWAFTEIPYEGFYPQPDLGPGDLAAKEDWTNHCERNSPARVLAECEAKRRIVDRLRSSSEWTGGGPEAAAHFAGFKQAMTSVLCDLALPYIDHADYDEEWRP